MSAMKPPMLEPRSATRTGRQQRRHRRHVVERAAPSAPSLSPWPRWSKHDRRHPGGAQRARQVELVLLLASRRRGGSPRRRRPPSGQEERVGQPVAGAQLGRWLDVDGAHDSGIMPRAMAAAHLCHVYPLGSRLTRPAASSSAAATPSSWRASSARPPTSWPRTTSAHARGRSARRSRAHGDGLRGLFASKAFPCTAVLRVLREEGLACDAASGGELHLALRGGFDPARIYLHGNAKSERELREGIDAGVGHIVIDNYDDIDRLERLVPDGAAASRSCSASRPGSAATRTTSSPPASRTRSSASPWTTPARHRARSARTGSSCAACTCTSARRSSSSARSARRSRRSPASASSRSTTSAAASASPTRPRTDRRRSRSTSRPRPTRCASSSAPACGSSTSRVARSWPTPASPCTRCESVKRNVVHLRRRRRGHVGQPAPDALRRALRGADRAASAAGRTATSSGKHCESGDLIVRDAELADPRPGRRRRHARPPAPTASRWPTTTTASRARRSSSAKDGDARLAVRRETYEDLVARDVELSEPFGVGLLGHGTVGSAFAELLEARAGADRGDHRAAARAARRADALARRLRGDPRALRPRGRADGRPRPGARLRPARDGAGQARRHRQQAAALPARRGAVGGGARARRAAALRGRGGRRRAGHPRAPGVARRRPRRPPARDRQRDDELHPHAHGARPARPTTTRWPRPRRWATPRPTRPRTSTARTPRPRWRSSRGWPSTRRCTSTRFSTRASSTSPPTTWSTRASSGWGSSSSARPSASTAGSACACTRPSSTAAIRWPASTARSTP